MKLKYVQLEHYILQGVLVRVPGGKINLSAIRLMVNWYRDALHARNSNCHLPVSQTTFE